MSYLAIDPGIDTGWCVLDASGHVSVVGKGEGFPTRSNRIAIIECPFVYPKQTSKKRVDPNNLLTLAVRVGRYQERLSSAGVRCNLVFPAEWKGQIDKLMHHRRIDGTLSATERDAVSRVAGCPWTGGRSYSHDVWDAVALAKWAFVARPLT